MHVCVIHQRGVALRQTSYFLLAICNYITFSSYIIFICKLPFFLLLDDLLRILGETGKCISAV